VNIKNCKREHKSHNQPFFDWWRNLPPAERGIKTNGQLFYDRKHKWEARVTACKALTPANRLHLRAIADLLTFETGDIAEAGTARVSLPALAKRCATSVKGIVRSIHAGERLGFLRVERTPVPGSHDECNVYTLTLPEERPSCVKSDRSHVSNVAFPHVSI
jgi:hypothetical protein